MTASGRLNYIFRAIVFLMPFLIEFEAFSMPADKLKFRHLTEENGLTNSHIYTISQDGRGFIWIGTENGLYRYDGHRFKHYLNVPGDTTSINSNVIFQIYYDRHNNLWIGTFMGLMRYDEILDRFIDLKFHNQVRNGLPVPINGVTENLKGSLIVSTDVGTAIVDPVKYEYTFTRSGSTGCPYEGNVVSTCMVDVQGNQWLATDAGVFRTDAISGQVKHYRLNEYSQKPFRTAYVLSIFQDSRSNVWIATREEGVFMKPNGSEQFIQFIYREADKHSLGSNESYDIYEDNENQIWISTNGGGLNLYDSEHANFKRFRHSPNDKNSLLNNNIRTLFEDRQGNVWIVSYQNGVNIYINHPQLFRYYDLAGDLVFDYQSSTVCAVYPYKNDVLWIGTDGGGLKLLNRKTNTIRTFLPNEKIAGSFPDKVVMNIYEDMYGTFWFGTYQGGLVKYEEQNRTFRAYQNNPADSFSISSNFVTCIIEDRNGNFWIGTNGGGLNLFDRKTQQFRAYQNAGGNGNHLVDNYINDILEDRSGNIWVATFWGLSRFNTTHFQFSNYFNDKKNSNSLSHNTIFCLFQDAKDRIWLGTRNGLNRYNPENNSFDFYNEKDGLPGNIIYSILDDESGYLWLSTNRGLSRFDPETKQAVNFTESDGLQGNEFFRNSSYKSRDGEMFFGGINGFNTFYPKNIQQRDYEPQVVVTALKIFDHEVQIGEDFEGRVILDKSITETTEIGLRYSDKIFAFELAAIDFITPENIVYAYMMEGFDKAWNYTSAKYPIISYTNLNPGDYTLKLKAGNQSMIDSVKSYEYIHITITPPIWRTWWAKGIYILLFLIIIYLAWLISMQRIRERNQVRLEILRREQAEELNQAKLRFFTNISHEFRTPLTLIISPIEQLLKEISLSDPIRRPLDIMLKNALRLLRLVNQLLDFRKIEGGKMALRTEYADIIGFIKDIVHSFEEYAGEKHVNFKFASPLEEYNLWFDADKLDKILFNLLSNAFKFTPETGSIKLSVRTNAESKIENGVTRNFLLIAISDTGPGIPEKDLPFLFDRFYQADNHQSFYQGSGLGLSLTKHLTEIHKGFIEVDTSPAGSTFRVYIPQGEDHLSPDEKITTDSPGLNKYIHILPESVSYPESNHKTEKEIQQLHNKPTILLVEDNLDLKNYIEHECRQYYIFYNASDGNEGNEMAVEIMPDLIITDVMMPGMNGLDFCKKVKSNMVTSHIPVIILTAKNAIENQIEGFESGADAYISKPFQIDQLIATANSIIENRARLREKFHAGTLFSKLPIKNTADDKFLQKVSEAIHNHISEVEFGVIELSKTIGISRVHLHRKLKAIANYSPNEFIKNIRLQKAGELLLKKEFTISEVCYKVGFNSPAYFSSCFKTYYKMSPTDFIEKNS
jgi:signal transduction histidine kinase/ligand-binding sensor domain-containing protein/DNA-binding response OmpR family regulator